MSSPLGGASKPPGRVPGLLWIPPINQATSMISPITCFNTVPPPKADVTPHLLTSLPWLPITSGMRSQALSLVFRAWPALGQTYFSSMTIPGTLPLLPAPKHVVPGGEIVHHLLYPGSHLLPTFQTQWRCHHLLCEDSENAPVPSIRTHAALDIGARTGLGASGGQGPDLPICVPSYTQHKAWPQNTSEDVCWEGPE